MLNDIVKAVDSNGDGVIQYEGMLCSVATQIIHCLDRTPIYVGDN